jgi:hypothetical protein
MWARALVQYPGILLSRMADLHPGWNRCHLTCQLLAREESPDTTDPLDARGVPVPRGVRRFHFLAALLFLMGSTYA